MQKGYSNYTPFINHWVLYRKTGSHGAPRSLQILQKIIFAMKGREVKKKKKTATATCNFSINASNAIKRY